MKQRVTVYYWESTGKWDLYDESGCCVEPDFDTAVEAGRYAKDNGYELTDLFMRL